MKTILLSLLALGAFATALAVGPVDRAAAGEQMVLTDAQLDRVTAGRRGQVQLGDIVIVKELDSSSPKLSPLMIEIGLSEVPNVTVTLLLPAIQR
jgi:hypothetical protein